MQREAPQHVRLLEPMLVELRRQFDEIGIDAGARDHRIGHVRQDAVQRVAEFVEQRARVVEGQQRGFAVGALGEIHHVDDQRADIAAQLFLLAQRGHPGAAMLGGPREIIAEEQRDMRPAASVTSHTRTSGCQTGMSVQLLEAQTEQPCRGVEGGLDDPVELQIGLGRRLIDIVQALAQLLGVIAPVPGRDLEIAALGLRPAPASASRSASARFRARGHTSPRRSRTRAAASWPSDRRADNRHRCG